ncbi:MAG: hypothetical protein QM811_10685 [Pirellulales bacterium]
MGKLLGLLGATMLYFCVATVITFAIGLVYAKSQGYLAPERVADMLAIARGEEPVARTKTPVTPTPPADKPKNYFQREDQRQIGERNLELREQALRNEREVLANERVNLQRELEQFMQQKAEYAENLRGDQDKARQQGRDTIRQLWETVKPKLAKDLILAMIDKGEIDETALILRDMPIAKQAKIVAEFKVEEEQTKLDDLLRLLRVPREANLQRPANDAAPNTR